MGSPDVERDRLSLVFAPDPAWLPLVEDVVRQFAVRLRFPARLTEMLVAATLEACDNLALAARERGLAEECRLGLAAAVDAVSVELDYPAAVPLNPLAAGDYEVPDTGSDPASVRADALWLYLIRRRMDKVYFRINGSRHLLTLVKYRRQEGREDELWCLPLTPRLAPDVHLEEGTREAGQPERGLLYNPITGVALRLGPSELCILRRFDGETSLEAIVRAHDEALGPIAPAVVAGLYERLEENGFLETAVSGRRRAWDCLKRLLNPNFSIPHADAVVTAVYRRSAFLVGPFGAALLLLIGLSGVYPLWEHAMRLHSLHELEAFYLAQPLALVALYLLLLVMLAAHEFGHGVVCKHFGGRVHRLGIMFYLASCIFYCDTTSAEAFPRTGQRVLVSLAGPLVTFACLGVGLWLAGPLARPGSALEYVAITFCWVCAFVLVMDCNPFLKMDAYYLLMHVLHLPGLRERSFAYLQQRLFGWLSPSAPRPAESDPRERRIFWWYGIGGAAFTLVFVLWPILFYGVLLARYSASQGRLLWGAAVLTFACARLAHQAYAKIASWRHREYRIQ